MYEEYYKLTRLPFQLGPNTDFFYASSGHQRALSYLQYGVTKQEGFIAITGEVGAGKSTLVERLLGELEDENI